MFLSNYYSIFSFNFCQWFIPETWKYNQPRAHKQEDFRVSSRNSLPLGKIKSSGKDIPYYLNFVLEKR